MKLELIGNDWSAQTLFSKVLRNGPGRDIGNLRNAVRFRCHAGKTEEQLVIHKITIIAKFRVHCPQTGNMAVLVTLPYQMSVNQEQEENILKTMTQQHLASAQSSLILI